MMKFELLRPTASNPINDVPYGKIPASDDMKRYIAGLDRLIEKQTAQKGAVAYKGMRASQIDKYLKPKRPFKLDGFMLYISGIMATGALLHC